MKQEKIQDHSPCTYWLVLTAEPPIEISHSERRAQNMAAASDSIGNNFIEKYIDVVDMQDLTNKQKLDANELFQSEISSHIYENKKKMKCSIKLYPLNLIGEHVIL